MKNTKALAAAGAVVATLALASAGCPPTPAPPAPAPAPSAAASAAPPAPPSAPAAPASPAPAGSSANTPSANANAPSDAPAPATPATPANGATASAVGTVAGRVTISHAVTPPAPIVGPKDAATCGNPYQPDQADVGPDGGVAGVVVWLKGSLPPWKPLPGTTFVVDQKSCHFAPSVLVAPAGQPVSFHNSDDVLHNVMWSSTLNKSENFGVPAGQSIAQTIAKPEVVELQCSVHSFMTGALVVLDNPYFKVTDAHGAFSIGDVPAGTYKLQAWHPILKRAGKPVTVTIDAAKTAEVDLHFE